MNKKIALFFSLVLICFLVLILHVNYKDNIYSMGKSGTIKESNIPKCPLIIITTKNEMTFDKVTPPKKCIGRSIKNNNYVAGNLSIKYKNKIIDAGQMQIRVRGNTSANTRGVEKFPYKINFLKLKNLFSTNKTFAKEWILLKYDTLKPFIGFAVTKLCQDEWVPQYEIVNVVINNDYKGCYILMQDVADGIRKNSLKRDGILLENDAYFWNEELPLKTLRNESPFIAWRDSIAYTVKYPKVTNLKDYRVEYIKDILNKLENKLFTNNFSYEEIIDTDSFVNWLLVHDILASADAAGSNMFMYLDSINNKNSKLKMATAWDFDSMFEKVDDWAEVRKHDMFYYVYLFNDPKFRLAYFNRWKQLKNIIRPTILNQIKEFVNKNKDIIQQSWDLDVKRWGGESFYIDQEVEKLQSYLALRTRWINENIKKLFRIKNLNICIHIDEQEVYNYIEGTKMVNSSEDFKYYLDKITFSKQLLKIEGWCYIDKEETENQDVFLEVENEKHKKIIFLAIPSQREDIVKKFNNKKYLNSGFKFHVFKKELPRGNLKYRIVVLSGNKFAKTNKFNIKLS